MDRKEFIKTCGFACIGATAMSALLQSCTFSKMITVPITGSDLIFPKSDFEIVRNENKRFKKYLVVQNDQLKYPICVFHLGDNNYTALLMSCPHQGAELQVFGDKLQCPAHGSEFDNHGVVQNAPADRNLRHFPVTVDNTNIIISLK
jgi:Rieske Fe-S protein